MAITELEFAERVKSKYPQYKNIDDAELVSLVLDRYPEYKTQLGEKEYSKNLLTNSAKTLISGGVQAAINAGAGVQQSYSMLLGDKSDTSEEAVKEYASQRRVKQRKGGSRMAQGKILAHRKRKNELIQTLNENAHRLRNLANSTDERFNIDPEFANSFGGQVLKGFGQMVSNIGSLVVGTAVAGPVGGVATAVGTIAPQMVSEAVSDAEATLGKSYMDMTEEEKEGVALTTASYATLGTALEFVPAARIPWVKNFLRGKTKVAAGELKSPVIRREIAKGFAAEGFTEAAQGQLLDSLARATFDDDRELMSWDVLRQRFNEFAVGGVVGGGTRGGIATIQKAAQGDLFKPKETKEVQTEGTTKQVFDVSYTDQKTGQPATIEIDAESQEEAVRIVEGGLAQSAVEGTIVARPKAAPEPVTQPEPGVTVEVIPETEQAELQEDVTEPAPAPTPAPQPAPVQEVDSEAVKEQQDTIDDAETRIADLQSEIEIEKGNIKEARARNKKEIADVRKSELSKEEKAEQIEELKTSLQDEIDDINGNIGIYKEEISGFKKDLRKAKKKLAGLQPKEVTAGAAPVQIKSIDSKESIEYNLLNSPFIQGYSGAGPQDSSIPNYGSFHYVVNDTQQQALNSAIQSGAVDALADEMVQEATEMMKDPEVSAGIGWYGRMRTRLDQIFGADRDLFTHLLGTTSAQTAVEQNFRYSVNLYNRFKAGEFDTKIKKYLALRGRLQAGTLGDLLIRAKIKNSKGVVYTKEMVKKSDDSALLQAAARHYKLLPRQPDGQLFGANSYAALKALSQVWFADRLGKNRMTPKTPQFAMNLNGQSLEATIDVWAARSLRRIIYKGQEESRIVPSEETAVSNPDFALGQLIFSRAAKKLNMNPDDLQAVVWFGEKKIWDQNGWTGAAGALKSSFDEPAEVFYPSDGTTRSEADANLILDFLATERLVQRDIAFPEAVQPVTQSNNRKKYDEYLRRSIISDFLQSRGRGAVYEGESVESDRRRQVTRAINRLRGFSGKVRYRKGTGKEPTRSLRIIERGSVLSGKQFSAIAKRNQKGNKFGSSVDVLTEAEYEGYDLIVVQSKPGANVTLSISPDGEVGSVTKSKEATSLDVAAAFDMAISTGKVKFLNGFETVLPDKYASYGFIPVARLKFDPSQKPPGWSNQTYKKYNNGEPDVIFMRLGGQIGNIYDPTGFPTVDTYEQGINLASQDVTAQAAPVDAQGGAFNQNTLDQFITKNFLPLSRKIGSDIVPNYTVPLAQYNATQGVIEYNPATLAQRDQEYVTAAMREEMIHAAMSKVILKKAKGKNEGEAFKSFMDSLGKSLTPEQRTAISQVYQGLETDAQFGAEYSRAAIQQLLYGNVTESFITQGPAFAKIKALLKSVQAYIAKTFKADVTTDPEAAAIIVESARLLQTVDPNAKPVEQKAIDKAMAYSQDVNPNAEVTSQQVAESGKPPSEKKLNVNFARKYLFTVSSLLNSIHPRLKELIRRYYSSIQGEVLDYQKRVAPFFKKYRGIKNADDRKRLKQLLSYSPVRQEGVDPLIEERDALLRKYDLFNDYQLEIRPVLNELYNRLQDEGIMVGFLEEYFPRSIKDLEKVKNRAGPELRDAFREFIKARNERIEDARGRIEEGNPRSGDVELSKETTIQIGNPKTAALEAQQWDQFTRGFNAQGRRNLPGNFLSRSKELEEIPDNLLDAYEDPGAAMERYIYNAVTAIQTTRLMGSKFANVPEGLKVPPASELGLLIQELRANGEISMEDADGTVPDIFAMILSPVQVENIYFQLARTFGYGTLLVEFTSTLSQLYDLPFIMLDNGIFGTAVAMFGPRLKGDDFGIDVNQVSVEFASDNRVLEKAVRLGLRASGFTKLDQVMKETNLTANYNRYRKLARGYFKDRNSAKSKKFVAELTSMGYSAQEQTQLIADLQKGNRDSAYIRTLLFNKLSETQPLTKAEMALGIVNNPNLRFTVAMKSFMIKQLNFVKDRMINEFIDGVRTNNARKIKKASSDLALLMTFLLLIGLPVDALKDFLAGRLGYMSDYLFNGVFRIAGISRYTAYQARKEGVGQAAFDYVTPVAIQQFVDATSELDRVVRGERAITESKFVTLLPFSDVINRIFGFQQGRERKEYMRRIREGESPFIIPPGAL